MAEFMSILAIVVALSCVVPLYWKHLSGVLARRKTTAPARRRRNG